MANMRYDHVNVLEISTGDNVSVVSSCIEIVVPKIENPTFSVIVLVLVGGSIKDGSDH